MRLFHKSTRDEFGGLRTPTFDQWFTEKENNLAKTLKAESTLAWKLRRKLNAEKGGSKGKDKVE